MVPVKDPGNFQSDTLWEGLNEAPTGHTAQEKRKLSWGLHHSFPVRKNQKEPDENDLYLSLLTSKVVI